MVNGELEADSASPPTVVKLPSGALVAVWSQVIKGKGKEEGNFLFAAASTTGGKSWSVPARIHSDTSVSEHSFDSVAVTGHDQATIVWLDSRDYKVIAALATARLLKSSILKSSSLPFALELPEYRWPTLRSLGVRLFDRAKLFLKNAGTVILLVALVLWVMAHLPLVDGRVPQLRDSAIGHLGQWMEPLIKPLGFNWKVGIGLLTSVFAREVIVGTFGTIYGTDPATRSLNLQEALRHDLSPGAAAALVVFFAFAMQCSATLAVVRRETNSWKWPILQFLYMGSLAYAAAWLTNLTVSQLWRL